MNMMKTIDHIIIKREYMSAHLPPSSPELNLTKHFWSILKCKQNKFSDVETFGSRNIKASEAVPLEHLHNFDQHSVN